MKSFMLKILYFIDDFNSAYFNFKFVKFVIEIINLMIVSNTFSPIRAYKLYKVFDMIVESAINERNEELKKAWKKI